MVVVVVHVVSYLLQLHYSRPILLLMSFASPLRCFFISVKLKTPVIATKRERLQRFC